MHGAGAVYTRSEPCVTAEVEEIEVCDGFFLYGSININILKKIYNHKIVIFSVCIY